MTSERDALLSLFASFTMRAQFILHARKDEVMLACEMHTLLTMQSDACTSVTLLQCAYAIELYKLGYDCDRSKRHYIVIDLMLGNVNFQNEYWI